MPPLFHSEAISFVRRANFIKKATCRNKSLFLEGVDTLDPPLYSTEKRQKT